MSERGTASGLRGMAGEAGTCAQGRGLLLGTVALGAVLAALPQAAQAQCVDMGGDVICSADDTDGFTSSAGVDSITVNNGVTVDDSATGGTGRGVIDINGGVTGDITNNGTVIATETDFSAIRTSFNRNIGGRFLNTGTLIGSNTIDVGNILGGFVNEGTITANEPTGAIAEGVVARVVTGGFVNTGTITATAATAITAGVDIGDLTGDFLNGGTITATAGEDIATGVETDNVTGNVTNTGTVTATAGTDTAWGFDMDDITGSLTNTGTVTATAGTDTATGFNIGDITGSFTNDGTIGATAGSSFAVAFDPQDISGSFTNSGTITGTSGDRVADGVEIIELGGNFTNTGTITATAGTTIADAVEITDISGNFTNTGMIAATAGTGTADAVEISSLSGNFLNEGTITANAGTDTAIAVEVRGDAGGDVTNTGTITATAGTSDAFGIRTNTFSGDISGSFTNTGTVTATAGTNDAIGVRTNNVGGDVTNSGTITATAGAEDAWGFDVEDITGSFTNTGTITAAAETEFVYGIQLDEVGGDVINHGTITASTDDGRPDAVEIDNIEGSFINSGTITVTNGGTGGYGVDGRNVGGDVINSGTIIVTVGGVSPDGIDVGDVQGDFVNSGTIKVTAEEQPRAATFGNLAGDFINTGTLVADDEAGLSTAIRGFTIAGVISNSGTVTSTGDAIFIRGSADTAVENSGTMTGSVRLGDGTNRFDNLSGGLFNAGPLIDLGAGNRLSNDGMLSVGEGGTVQTTTLTGDLVQGGGGTLAVDLDTASATSDLLDVSGTADLAGTLVASATGAVAGPQSFTVLSAAGGTTDTGLTLQANPVLQAELQFPNANDVVIATELSFAAPGSGLNQNQTNLGAYLDGAFTAGGGGLGTLFDDVVSGATTLDELADLYDQLGAESFLGVESAALSSSLGFADNLMSCPVPGRGNANAEGQCAWAQVQGRFVDRDATGSNIGFEEDVAGLSAGVQYQIAPDWHLGFGVGFETGEFETTSGVTSDVERLQAGVTVKHTTGPWLFAGSLSGGTSNNDMERTIDLGGSQVTAASSPDVRFVNAGLRAAYLIDRTTWYIKPLIDVNATYVSRDGVTETGGGAANLTLEGSDEVYLSASPAVNVGYDTTVNGRDLRAFVNAGVTVLSDDTNALTASFASAPAGLGGFTASSDLGRFFGDIEAGVTLFDLQNFDLTARYRGSFSSDTRVHQLQLRASIDF